MSMSLSNKRALASQSADHEADFDALFHQHWERICRILFSILGDWSEAEDLALETFVRLHQRPPAQADNLGGWLYRVATNMGLNALRARQRRQRYEEQAGARHLEEYPPQDPAAAIEREQERQRVRAALSAIPQRAAQILILRHSGFSYREVASAVGVAPGSVGTLLARAEKQFERAYKKV